MSLRLETGWLLACSLVFSGCKAAADMDVVSVEHLGEMEEPASMEGRDGGDSGLFRGRSVWVFGDGVATEAGTYPSTWRNNTMSWTEDLDASDGLSGLVQPEDTAGAAKEFFPRTEAEETFNRAHSGESCEEPCGARYAVWGSGPVMDEARDRAILSYALIYAEPGPWNFHPVGTSLALWTDFDEGPERPEVDSEMDEPTLLFGDDVRGHLSTAPVVHEEHLYLFGCPEGGSCYLARAALDEILVRQAWRFYDGKQWRSDASEGKGIMKGSENMTVHFNAYLDRWMAVYMNWGKGIVGRTAEQLEGPWSREVLIYKPEEGEAMHGFAHAELAEEDGRIQYISYVAEEIKLIRVELERR